MARFKDRREAGKRLAEALSEYAAQPDVIVLGLPRGGVPVAYEVAEALDAPMDVFIVRKLGVPGHEEYAMGAIASGGIRVLNPEAMDFLDIDDRTVEAVAQREKRELERREQAYRGDRPMPNFEGKTVILVDDGLATGASMRAAVEALKTRNPEKIVVAVPAAAPESCAGFQDEVDEVVCVLTPQPFFGVGAWYQDFSQTTDEEVSALLQRARQQ